MISLDFIICELTVPQVEPLLNSLIEVYYKLRELGVQEVNGKIVYIDDVEVSR